ncbi:HAMP domain-containing sensor histidine kinase [Actinomyces sp. MRS3W]|uniref:sensor histidine kinase n=1 Tax=Actinomyces sp. MRS3W TaxID=2800796 RepID=UPI0028FD7DE3|nr:HAMP domain-containing sensor histidine kinase [Actinomyces sp. MRS3W]MDU0347331.1 HAMP domain-containing sensor histidine kinase [Actinomyces sp. MRS3W]
MSTLTHLAVWWGLATTTIVAVVLAVRWRRALLLARRDNARLRRAAQRRSTPRDVLAHEIRTPLALISASAELLEEETPGDLNEVQRRFVTTILDNARDASQMAEDFLTEARLDHEVRALRLEKLELRGLVRDLVQEMRRSTRTPIRLEDHGRPVRLEADRGLLRQAVANTITNALRHSEGRPVTVRISAEVEDALITIMDDGEGMSREQQRRAFIPYATSNPLSAPSSRGAGLGMMVTQRIMEEHGGRVLIDTIAARGTTVYLTLPLRAAAPARTEPEAQEPTKENSDAG